MRRGDIVIAAEKGTFAGKPRPWLVIQSDTFLDAPTSVTVCIVSSSDAPTNFRIAVGPSTANGLLEPSVVFVDKVVTIRAEAVEKIVGTLEDSTMLLLDDALRRWLDL